MPFCCPVDNLWCLLPAVNPEIGPSSVGAPRPWTPFGSTEKTKTADAKREIKSNKGFRADTPLPFFLKAPQTRDLKWGLTAPPCFTSRMKADSQSHLWPLNMKIPISHGWETLGSSRMRGSSSGRRPFAFESNLEKHSSRMTPSKTGKVCTTGHPKRHGPCGRPLTMRPSLSLAHHRKGQIQGCIRAQNQGIQPRVQARHRQFLAAGHPRLRPDLASSSIQQGQLQLT